MPFCELFAFFSLAHIYCNTQHFQIIYEIMNSMLQFLIEANLLHPYFGLTELSTLDVCVCVCVDASIFFVGFVSFILELH